MSLWINADGLAVNLGTSEATPGVAGEFCTYGDKREIEVKIDLTLLSTGSQLILDQNAWMPKNARIEEVEVEVETGAVGATATLDFGLIRSDQTTELDYNGFIAAAAVGTLDTAGKRLNLITGSTAAGALIGTTLSNNGLFVAKAGTAVFTAGVVKARVKYYFI